MAIDKEITMTSGPNPNETGSVPATQDATAPANTTQVSAIEITNLSKTYGKRPSVLSSVNLRNYVTAIRGKANGSITALDRVNLRVRQGEVFGLLGPNGAGKTTLIKILSTLVLPDSGEALVYGVDVVRKPRKALRKLQTVLAQSSGFELRLSGRRNLELYAALYGIPKEEARKKIDYLLEFTGLAARADSPFQKYSTGMARKLLVSRALLSDASLLIFDEPTSSLDPKSALDFRKFMLRGLVDKEGKTVFLATHNLQEAQQVCDRIALIQEGKIVAVGTPAQIRAQVGDRVSLSIVLGGKGDYGREELNTQLRRIDGLADLGIETLGHDLLLNVTGDKDLNYNGIFELLLRLNLKIMTLEASEPSLEEAFLSLVGAGKE